MYIDYDDDVFANIFDSCPFWSSQFGLTVLEHIDFSHPMTVLDLGTGTGFPAIEIAERLGRKSVVFAIDVWDAALKRAEMKARALGVSNIVFKTGSALELPFEDASFDLIVSCNCLNNVDRFDTAVTECRRTLKNGGKLLQTFNLPDSLSLFYDIFKSLLAEKDMHHEVDLVNAHIHEKRKSTDFTKKETEKAGFRVTEISEHCFTWPFLDGTSLLGYSFVRSAWLPSWHSIVPEAVRASFFTELEDRLNAYAAVHGGLRLQIPYSCIVAET